MTKIKELLKQGKPCVHLSIDDSILGLQEAFTANHESIFDSDYFSFLRNLHEETQVPITHYLFFENKTLEGVKDYFNLSMADKRYKKEFIKNPWLKFGIHALNRQTPMTSQTTKEVKQTVNDILNCISKYASKENIATTWRPHYLSADKDACDIMSKKGVDVLLTPEDGRKIVACLEPEVVKSMMKGGSHYDKKSNFLLVHTSYKIEDTSLTLDDMKKRIEEDIKNHGVSAIYTHEYELVKSGKNFIQNRDRLLQLMKYVKQQGYMFAE